MIKRILILLLPLLVPGVLFGADFFQTISMDEVARLMKSPGVVLLDVNVPELWEKYHLPGAVHVGDADIAGFLPADKRATRVFYCAGPLCTAGGMAANESVLLGYRRVYVMTDGIFGWVRSGYPVVSATSVNKGMVP
jgi:rhodanese-related sulfurtransferase